MGNDDEELDKILNEHFTFWDAADETAVNGGWLTKNQKVNLKAKLKARDQKLREQLFAEIHANLPMLYEVDITDLERDEHAGEEKPVVYLDSVIATLDKLEKGTPDDKS